MLPELVVDDLAASVAFYALLGFRIAYERPAERFVYLTRGGGVDLMLEQVGPGDRLHPRAPLERPYGRGVNLSIDVEDVDAVQRALTVADPDGYVLRPTQTLGARPYSVAPA